MAKASTKKASGENNKSKQRSAALNRSKADVEASARQVKETASDANAPSFPVVGVGASAGGLEAFTQLLKAIPDDPGMAFVLIPHLDPTHESAMTELLARATRMRVFQVHDGIRLNPNQVYVIPPNRDMTVADGALRLVSRERSQGMHMPIDTFLRSLASELRSNAIGVILSGTASDGTLGVVAIKSEGGITLLKIRNLPGTMECRTALLPPAVSIWFYPRRELPRNSFGSGGILTSPIHSSKR